MYKKILMPLETAPTDRAIIEHVKPLAELAQAQPRRAAARRRRLGGAEFQQARTAAESEEMTRRPRYLEKVRR